MPTRLSWEDLPPESRARLRELNPHLMAEIEPEATPPGAPEGEPAALTQPVLPRKRFETVLGNIDWVKVALFIGFLLLALKY